MHPLAYFGNNAFVFVDGQGKRLPVRYQIIPTAGLVNLDSASAAKQGANYLQEELQRRLARGPVQFRLFAQLPHQGDPTKDGSIVWPTDRKRIRQRGCGRANRGGLGTVRYL